ncbi:hypothetical protein BS78_04G002700 [Paspalum vaginatum]|nr:hypothetical protein BS78_04G002700 [Paspalum vaginatum]
MGCVSSALLEGDGAQDDRRRIISLSHHHQHQHVVSLTSSTYGILTSPRAYCSSSSLLPPIPPPRRHRHSNRNLRRRRRRPPPTVRPSATPKPKPESHPPPEPQPQPAEVINSWELMAGLVDPSTPAKQQQPACSIRRRIRFPLRPIDTNSCSSTRPSASATPPASVVLYTTSLRGVRSTFESCNAVRAVLQAHGVAFRERDVSMDRGFREELRDLTRGLPALPLPRLFVGGRHVGGADEVLRLDEEGLLAPMLDGLPTRRVGGDCDGCGGMRFLPCFDCSGSRKVVVTLPPPAPQVLGRCCDKPKAAARGRRTLVVRCAECNENGLVLCPICS